MSERLTPANPFKNAKVVATGVDPECYHRQDPGVTRGDAAFVMGSGALRTFAQCPSRWRRGYSPKDTDATDYGSMIDCRVLDSKRFSEVYVVAPETYLADGRKRGDPQIEKPWNRNATACKEWEASQNGKIVIKTEERDECETAFQRLISDVQIAAVLRDSDKQVMAVAEYHDRATDIVVSVKILIDILPTLSSSYAKMLFDLKTSVSADPALWPKFVFQRGYHWQAAMYLDVYTAATGEDRLEFGHIVQENYSPFECSKMVLSQEFMLLGRESYVGALRKYCQCLATGEWPSYPPSKMCLNSWNYIDPDPFQMMRASRENKDQEFRSEMAT